MPDVILIPDAILILDRSAEALREALDELDRLAECSAAAVHVQWALDLIKEERAARAAALLIVA